MKNNEKSLNIIWSKEFVYFLGYLWSGFNKPKIKKLKKDEYMNYNESLIYIQQFNLKNKMEWNNFCKNGNRPTNIPSNPYDFYKGIGWTTWGEWLGFK